MDTEARIATLEAQLALMATELAALRHDPVTKQTTTGRRQLIRTIAKGAVGAVVGGAVIASSAEPAAAAPGFELNVNNVGTTTTILRQQTSTAVGSYGILQVTDNAFYASTASIVAGAGGAGDIALYAIADGSNATAVEARGSAGTGLRATGNTALSLLGSTHLQFEHDPIIIATPTPSGVPYTRGAVLARQGNLWYCVVPGSPGSWRKLAAVNSAGQLHLLNEPLRGYDSRNGDGKLAAGQTRTVSLANGTNGAGGNVVAVPTGTFSASGALVTLTITDTEGGGGFLKLYTANLAGPPATSTINWSAVGQNLATTTVTALTPAAQVKVTAGVNSTHFLIDVIGYYQ